MLELGIDQAASLRKMFSADAIRVLPVVASATLVEMTARAFATDRRTVVIDHTGDEIAQAFGRFSSYDLADLLTGDQSFQEVAVRINSHLSILRADKGIDQFLEYAGQTNSGSESLFNGFLRLKQPFEWLVIHTYSLVSAVRLVGSDGEIALVVDDNAEAIQDAYCAIKEAVTWEPDLSIRIVISGANDVRARQVFERMADAARRFLGVQLRFGLALPPRVRAGVAIGTRLRAAVAEWQTAEFNVSD